MTLFKFFLWILVIYFSIRVYYVIRKIKALFKQERKPKIPLGETMIYKVPSKKEKTDINAETIDFQEIENLKKKEPH